MTRWLAAASLVLAACDEQPLPTLPKPVLPAIELIGWSDLLARGMNGALTITGTTAYVGSYTDSVDHTHAGVLIVDISDPSSPVVVGEIGPPDEGLPGMSSQELRILPSLDLLVVMNAPCEETIGGCTRDPDLFPATFGAAELGNMKVYDIRDRLHPRLLSTYVFDTDRVGFRSPHEFFVWGDPEQPDRYLLFFATPPIGPIIEVLELADRAGPPRRAALFALEDAPIFERIHSLSVSQDGSTGYVSYWSYGFLMLDTSAVAQGGSEIRLLTPLGSHFDPSPPDPPALHSAVKLPNRNIVLATDEVYPPPIGVGCPGGWARFLDVSDPTAIRSIGEYKVPENDPARCDDPSLAPKTFTPHNPTVTEHLALITWYAAGLQIIDTTDPTHPKFLTSFVPEPLPTVAVEDPALPDDPIQGSSYPIIQNGLIYFVDSRNGLYILRYTGPFDEELDTDFQEGNSSL
jgi:hypothetical protein